VPSFGFWYLATIAGKILTNFVEHWGHVGFYFIRTSIYTNIEAFTLWVSSLCQLTPVGSGNPSISKINYPL
jgi:hypothetical protein